MRERTNDGWLSERGSERSQVAFGDVSVGMVRTICSRRSIRSGFTSAPIPDKIVEEIVRCGLTAPSSKNAQPWCLHVVTQKPLLVELADLVQDATDAENYVPIDPETGEPHPDWPSTVTDSADVLRQVSLGIFVENRGEFSGGRHTIARASPKDLDAALVGYTLEVLGLGAAIENMWLAAQSYQLRGLFMGDILIAEDEIRERLRMSGDLVGVLALGYSTGRPRTERFWEDGRMVLHD